MRSLRVLCGDIGGTKTRLAVFEVDGVRLNCEIEKTYASTQYASLDAIIAQFISETGARCTAASFGIAGPVKDGKGTTTNLPWVVETRRLAQAQGFRRVHLINDLEATAWGIAALQDEDFFVLSQGRGDGQGNAAVIAAGTGLGEAGMFWDGRNYHPFATEGGHANFSPSSELEVALLKYLSGRFDNVSWEHVLSGSGLVNLFEFLRDKRRIPVPHWLQRDMQSGDAAAAISRSALEGRCDLCAEALDLFIHLYGAEAGNLALKLMATGGVYIGGGIAPKILNTLKGPAFMRAFHTKGPMQSLMETISVKVILNDRTALLGSAILARGSSLVI